MMKPPTTRLMKNSPHSVFSFETSTWLFLGVVMVLLVTMGEASAVTTTALRAPMATLKTEVFDWMTIVKIASVAVGSVFGLIKQSLTPFGIGAGITAGIVFFDSVIGDVTGALI